jgi:hypothetical protein
MKRFLLTSCACSLVLAVMAGNSALGQQTQTYSTTQTVPNQVTDTSSGATEVHVTGDGTTVDLTNSANSYSGGTVVDGNSVLKIDNDKELGNASGGVTLGDSTDNGTLWIKNSGTPFSSGRSILLNAGGGVIYSENLSNGSPAVTTLSGVVSGAGQLTVTGPRTVVYLTNVNNSYTGGTWVNGGATLQIGADAALGNSLVTTLNLGDGSTHGTLQLMNTGGGALSISREILLGVGGGSIVNTSGQGLTIAGTITDWIANTTGAPNAGGNLTLTGNGINNIISLSGSNLFTGNLYVTQGTVLAINSDYALGGYTVTTNALTGLASYTLSSTPNTLFLQGATLQIAAPITIAHPIQISNGANTIDADGNTAVFTAPISDGGSKASLTITNSSNTTAATVVLDGINTYTGGTTVTGGTQTATLVIGDANNTGASVQGNVTVGTAGLVGGTGTIAGALINQGGTVAPAAVLTATSYVQTSGNLSPVIGEDTSQYSSGTKALMNVTGSATINGGYLAPGFASGFLRAGRYLIFQAGSLSGAGFAGESLTVPSIGLTGQIVQQGDQFFVVLTQLPSLPTYDKPTIIPVLTNAALDEGQQAIGTLLDRLAGVRTNALADELNVALTESHRVRGTSPYGVWVMPLGNNGTVNGSNGVAGYNTQGGGLMAGIDTEWMRSVSIGVALGYTNNFVKQSDGNAGTVSMPRLAVYGGWWKGPFAIDAVVGFGMGIIDATRPVAAPSVFETAYSNHVANEKSAALQASAAWAWDGWVIGPALGAKFLNLRQTGFTESGTDLYNFSADAQTTNSLRPYGNLLFTKRFMVSDHWALIPELKVGMEHEVANGIKRVTVQTQGDLYDWTYAGLLTGDNMLRLDGGLKLETSRDAAFFVDYNHMQSSTSTNQYVSGGFRYRL